MRFFFSRGLTCWLPAGALALAALTGPRAAAQAPVSALAPTPCGTDAAQRRLLDAGYDARWQHYRDALTARRPAAGTHRRTVAVGPRLIVPVVVHIIHDGGPSNLADEQIFDAIRILNEDFRALNADTAAVIPMFQNRIGNTNLEFRLARRDPQGNCTNGITHTFSPLTNSADDNVKDLIGWDGERYLNIWVVKNISFGAAGYAYLPCWVGPDIDGIVMLNSYIGSIGLGNPRNSRTLTHEVGHYLGLPHTWGMTNSPGTTANCQDDDGVSDTPNTVGSSPGNCNLRQRACPGDPDTLSNVQNFMDYSYCSTMFTQGQSDVMYDGLALGTFGSCHATLTTLPNLTLTGVADGLNLPPCAPVVAIEPGLGASDVSAARGCVGDSVRFTGTAYNLPAGATPTWSWSFPGGQPATSTRRNPVVAYAAPGRYDVTLTATVPGAAAGTLTATDFARISARTGALAAPVVETFDNPQFPLNPANPLADWDISATPSTPAPTATWMATTTAVQGTGAVRIVPLAIPRGSRHELTSPTIEVPTALWQPRLSFRQAYAFSGNMDRLEVDISTDCGRSWSTRLRRAGSGLARGNTSTGGLFVPTPAQWNTESLGLGGYVAAGTTLRVRFRLISDQGNALYLDEVRISGQTPLGIAPDVASTLSLDIAPNPGSAAEGAVAHLTVPIGGATLRVSDAVGRCLGSQSVRGGAREVPIADVAGSLAPGFYVVELLTDAGERRIARAVVR